MLSYLSPSRLGLLAATLGGLALVVYTVTLITHAGAAPIALETPSSQFLTEAQLRAALAESPWPPALHDEVIALAWCESGLRGRSLRLFNSAAVGDAGKAFGLLQINVRWNPWASYLDLEDPRVNLLVGWAIWMEAGRSFVRWSCYRNNSAGGSPPPAAVDVSPPFDAALPTGG